MDFLEEWIWFIKFEGYEIVKDLLKIVPEQEILNELQNYNNKFTNNEYYIDIFNKALTEYRIEDIERLYRIIYYIRMHIYTFKYTNETVDNITLTRIINDWKYYSNINLITDDLAYIIYIWGNEIKEIKIDLEKYILNN